MPPPRPDRIALLDVARGGALLAMAIYHFAWDLEFFGYVTPGLTALGGWKLFARMIASSFLVIAGTSLFLAHGEGVRRQSFLRRLAQVAGAALAISAVTRFAFPESFIYFGILHQIALASLVGLLFLRAPWWITATAAALFVAAPHAISLSAFDTRWLAWTGLAAHPPRSNDFVPLLPWTGAFLAGIALAQAGLTPDVRRRLAGIAPIPATAPLAFAGRRSLLVYLVHQPLLIGLVWLASLVITPTAATPEARFAAGCQRSCGAVRDEAFCARYCVCALDRLKQADRLDAAFAATPDADAKAAIEEIASACTAEADAAPEGAKP